MNKIYSAVAVMAMTMIGGSAFSQTLHSSLSVADLGEAAVASRADNGENTDEQKPGEVPAEIVNGGWKSIGEGMWYEDLICAYEDFIDATGTNWRIEIEESETTPGYYRMLPYYEGTIIAELNWEADWNYIYIDATDPDKVVAKDFAPYDYFLMSHTVPENGWNEAAFKGYGKLEDKVISFPPQAFSAYIELYGEWMITSFNEGVRIALPGATITDYSIHYSLDFCQTSSEVEFTLSYGETANKAVGGVYKGFYQNTEENIASIAKTGKELTRGEQYFELEDGMYTYFVVLLDEEDNVAASKVSNFFVYIDDKNQWTDIGTTDYSDDIYGSVYGSVMPFTQSHQVIVEQNKENAGLYRLKNPYYTSWEYYTRFNLHLDRHYHTHYIVIDATNPDKVVMKSSNLGVNVTMVGYGVVESVPSFNESIGQPAGDLYGIFKDGVISFPVNGLVFYEHADGRAYVANRNGRMKFAIPGTSGIDSVADSAEETPATYYNLSGMPVTHPVKGCLYIKRTADKAEKIIF